MNVCTHSHTFEQLVLGWLATYSQGTDSWLGEGMGACCSINEPSITHTHTARRSKHRKQETISFNYHSKESHHRAGSDSGPFFHGPNFQPLFCLAVAWLALLSLCPDPSQRSCTFVCTVQSTAAQQLFAVLTSPLLQGLTVLHQLSDKWFKSWKEGESVHRVTLSPVWRSLLFNRLHFPRNV